MYAIISLHFPFDPCIQLPVMITFLCKWRKDLVLGSRLDLFGQRTQEIFERGQHFGSV